MIHLAIIPARKGSKGLIDKNIQPLCGKPLLAYSIEAAREAGIFREIFVSTDSEEYAGIARHAGANVPFLRNTALATDHASPWDAAREAVEKYGAMGLAFDTVTLLQPTSPLRSAQDILAGFEKMKETDADMVVSVCEAIHSPLWSNTLPQDHSLFHFIHKDIQNVPRQDLPVFYRVNGALYIIKIEALMRKKELYSSESYAIVMSRENSIDIDDEVDMALAECIIQKKNT